MCIFKTLRVYTTVYTFNGFCQVTLTTLILFCLGLFKTKIGSKMQLKESKGDKKTMAYQFSNVQKANAYVSKDGTADTYKIAGVNGKQTNADNFHTAVAGLLHVVGKDSDASAGMGRTISQDVEDLP